MEGEESVGAAADGGRAVAARDEPAAIGVGMVGYGFMGRAHSIALRKLVWAAPDAPLQPRLVALCGRDVAAAGEVARRFGWERAVGDWRELVEDPAIGLISNGGPNGLHAEPTIAAARAGKHVLCEKPLGRDAEEAHAIWSAVAATGVVHMAGFNFRFFPAVALAQRLIASGALGEIRHFRARYLQSWLVDPAAPATWRLDAGAAGSGALGDLGSHVVDLARHLVGEPAAVTARMATFTGERAGGTRTVVVDVDDAFAATVAFADGAIGTLEATRVAPGRKNQLAFEVNGTRGSLAFDQERMNELEVCLPEGEDALGAAGASGAAGAGGAAGAARLSGAAVSGFRRVLVSEPDHHPFLAGGWPAGHTIGWEDSFVFEFDHLLRAIAGEAPVGPRGATFEDGYRCAEVCDAIARAARSGSEQQVVYRGRSAPREPARLAGPPG